MEKTCPKCGEANSAHAIYCVACGGRLEEENPVSGEEVKICPQCGFQNRLRAWKCFKCGLNYGDPHFDEYPCAICGEQANSEVTYAYEAVLDPRELTSADWAQVRPESGYVAGRGIVKKRGSTEIKMCSSCERKFKRFPKLALLLTGVSVLLGLLIPLSMSAIFGADTTVGPAGIALLTIPVLCLVTAFVLWGMEWFWKRRFRKWLEEYRPATWYEMNHP